MPQLEPLPACTRVCVAAKPLARNHNDISHAPFPSDVIAVVLQFAVVPFNESEVEPNLNCVVLIVELVSVHALPKSSVVVVAPFVPGVPARPDAANFYPAGATKESTMCGTTGVLEEKISTLLAKKLR